MLLSKRFIGAFVLLLLAVPVPAAEKDAEAAAERSKDAPADAVGPLIEQLDDDAFSKREAASRKLTEAGKTAIPALAEAALGDSLEVSTRSMRILRDLLESPDEETKTAARKALEKIAESNHPSSSPRAKEAIRPEAELPVWQPGNIAIAVRNSISVSNVNGVKTISVSENGRKIKIQDDPKKGIKVEVTETKGGKQVTRTTEAKNADELKKKNKEAFDLYKQYGKGGAMGRAIQFRIQAAAVPGGIQIQPIQPAIPRALGQRIQVLPGRPKLDPAKRIEAVTRQLRRLGKEFDKAIEDAEETAELQNALEQFQKELKKQLAELEKQLEKEDE